MSFNANACMNNMIQMIKWYQFLVVLLVFFLSCQPSTEQQSVDNEPVLNDPSTIFSQISDSLVIILLKKERVIEFWHHKADNTVKLITKQQITGPSLPPGPRLADHSVKLPEGIYAFQAANKIAFPNSFDLNKAKADDRKFTETAFELPDIPLFQQIVEVVQTVGTDKSVLIIAPIDLRRPNDAPACVFCPSWSNELYNNLRFVLEAYMVDE